MLYISGIPYTEVEVCILCDLGLNGQNPEDHRDEIVERLLNSDMESTQLHVNQSTPHEALRFLVAKLDAVEHLPDELATETLNAEIDELDVEHLMVWMTHVACALQNMTSLRNILGRRLMRKTKVVPIERDQFLDLIRRKAENGDHPGGFGG